MEGELIIYYFAVNGKQFFFLYFVVFLTVDVAVVETIYNYLFKYHDLSGRDENYVNCIFDDESYG